jgi:HEAT repeat protein
MNARQLSARTADPRPAVRLAGVEAAVEAMRGRRAAPAALTPTLIALTRDPSPQVRSGAVRALTGSLTATRLAADRLAALLDDPEYGTTVALALGRISDGRAGPTLARLMTADGPPPGLGEALAGVAGADPATLLSAARRVLATDPGPAPAGETWQMLPAELALHLLAALGPDARDAVPDLIARIRTAIDRDGAVAPLPEINVLGRIGPDAAAAVPLLRRYAAAEGTRVDQVMTALLKITSDRAFADRVLAGLPEELRRHPIAAVLLTWLTRHDGLTGRQHRQLRHLFAHRGVMQVRTAEALWRHEGPPVATELINELDRYVDDEFLGHETLRVFTAMGAHARPMLGRLDGLVRSPYRIAVNLPDPDSEMRADEALLAAATTARDRIAAEVS